MNVNAKTFVEKMLGFDRVDDSDCWRLAVDYANAGDTEGEHLGQLVIRLADFCFCLSNAGMLLEDPSEIEEVWRRQSAGESLADCLTYWAKYYQPEFKNLLTWLCKPKERADLGLAATRFLAVHSEGVKVDIDNPNDKFDEHGNDGYPIYFWPVLRFCKSVMSPVAKFIVDRTWRFQDGDLERSEALPIRLCDRPGCGRFKFVKRWRKTCYCSGVCRAAHRQAKKSPEEKAEYMRKYREGLKDKERAEAVARAKALARERERKP